MSMKTVKVDDSTDRVLADVAHFLGRMKKDVLREAVLMFAELHGRSLEREIARSSDRVTEASGSIERTRLVAAVGGDLSALPLRDRLTVCRAELIELIERNGARNPRLVGELAAGRDTETVELLVESDLSGDRWHQFDAMHLAQRLLGAAVEFTDATSLRLFAPERLERLEREAIAL